MTADLLPGVVAELAAHHNTTNGAPMTADKRTLIPGWTLQARYDDDRLLHIEPSHNHEVLVKIGDTGEVFVDGLDLLRVVSRIVLDGLYGPSPTEAERGAA